VPQGRRRSLTLLGGVQHAGPLLKEGEKRLDEGLPVGEFEPVRCAVGVPIHAAPLRITSSFSKLLYLQGKGNRERVQERKPLRKARCLSFKGGEWAINLLYRRAADGDSAPRNCVGEP